MTLKEVVDNASNSAEEFYSKLPANFYKDMTQDLKAMGKTDEHIIHEFITDAFLYGYCEVSRKLGIIEDMNDKE